MRAAPMHCAGERSPEHFPGQRIAASGPDALRGGETTWTFPWPENCCEWLRCTVRERDYSDISPAEAAKGVAPQGTQPGEKSSLASEMGGGFHGYSGVWI